MPYPMEAFRNARYVIPSKAANKVNRCGPFWKPIDVSGGGTPQHRCFCTLPRLASVTYLTHTYICTRQVLVLLAEDPTSGDTVIVKFSATYGREVHEAWATAGVAPKLLSCDSLPGGYWMTKTEYLDPRDGWICLCYLTEQDALQATTAVREALEVARSCLPGAVHGDLRAANTLVRRRKPMPGSGLEGHESEGIWEVRFIDFEVGQ